MKLSVVSQGGRATDFSSKWFYHETRVISVVEVSTGVNNDENKTNVLNQDQDQNYQTKTVCEQSACFFAGD